MVRIADRTDTPATSPAARWPAVLLSGVVALAFADASIVVLGLADIYGELDVGIVAVSWVVTAYAAAVVVVATGLAVLGPRVAPALALGSGLVLFAAGTVGSAGASTIEVLIGARVVQGVGAALLLSATLPILTVVVGAPDRAVRWWSIAGVLGAVLGPAVGGLLTQVFEWRAIFWAQAPAALAALALLALADVRAAGRPTPTTGDAPPEPAAPSVRGTVLANVAFALLFAAAVGALFLTVLCAIEVWRFEPLAGAAVVSALPAATLAVHPLAGRLGAHQRLAVGVVSLVGGLCSLALLVGAAPVWMGVSMAVCGVGFGCVAETIGRRALRGATARAGSITDAARHAGLVAGLVVTAPVLAASLDTGADDAAAQGVAVVLDADLDLGVKLGLVDDLRQVVLDTPAGEVPDVGPVFDAAIADASPDVAGRLAEVEDDLTVTIERALTRAFRPSFLIAAGFAALVALPAAGVAGLEARAAARSGAPRSPAAASGGWALAGVAIALVAAGLGRGAVEEGRYEPADPCVAARGGFSLLDGPDAIVQGLALDALDVAACRLGTTREWLVLALDEETAIGPARSIPRDDVADALREGAETTIDDAAADGALPEPIAAIVRDALAEVDILEWIENPTVPAIGD